MRLVILNLICLTESMDAESEAGDCELNMFDRVDGH